MLARPEALPNASDPPPSRVDKLALLLQEMVQIASQKALPSAMPLMFLPLSSFCYKDGAGMFTLTGIVCQKIEEKDFRKTFKNWRFANLDWNEPGQIDMPSLTTKERLLLQSYLACGSNAGKVLRRSLLYLIDKNKEQSEIQLQQYADFHCYFPYFMQAAP